MDCFPEFEDSNQGLAGYGWMDTLGRPAWREGRNDQHSFPFPLTHTEAIHQWSPSNRNLKAGEILIDKSEGVM